MAKKTYKRRKYRKSSSKKRTRRSTKKRSHNAKIWKYVKKATKSEVKRCDALYTENPSYKNTASGVATSWIYSGSRFLTQLVFFNSGPAALSPTLTSTQSTGTDGYLVGKARMWVPTQLDLDNLQKGSNVNNRVGDKIFLKYLNFKIQYETWVANQWEFYSTLYLIMIDRSVSASYTTESILNALWFNVSPCHEIDYSKTASGDSAYREKWGEIWDMSYHNKRKRFLKGIRIKKLASYYSTNISTAEPAKWSYYSGTSGVAGFQVEGTLRGQFYFRPKPKCVSKLVKINRELEYSVKDGPTGQYTSPRIDNVKIYLICVANTPKFATGDSDAISGAADLVCKVSCEAVFTDK